ncbi:MAG: GH39 family glycosyl hydrolase [Planctomycetota bacterium]|jgi:hypothetical protein
MPNFTDAPVDLSIDGRSWTTAKDYAQLHEVVRVITGHLIDRYGDAAMDFPWSVFNEPDLARAFWRSGDWDALQTFYDYTSDAILRAFEDRGYDSGRVMVGGLELGAIFGTNMKLTEFLAHCSPVAEARGALSLNAAYADARLDGQRSERVERLCRANGGRGAPLDFVSVHAYETSAVMAAKLIRAKEVALEIDPEYYAGLWINSHESCPAWDSPPDPAYGDSYLGNGYFSTWCADVVARQVRRAATDPRYAYGETILTFWPWPNPGFGGGNAATRTIHTDDDGDGQTDREVNIAMPILHFAGLQAQMGNRLHPLPERRVGAHAISGVVSGVGGRSDDAVRVLLYSHHGLDTESRSERVFEVDLRLAGLAPGAVTVEGYRFDSDHNSYYRVGRPLREARANEEVSPEIERRVGEATRLLGSDDVESQRRGIEMLGELGPAAKSAGRAALDLYQRTASEDIREGIVAVLIGANKPRPYPAAVVEEVERLSRLTVTGSSEHEVDAKGRLKLAVPVAANGANFLVIRSR